MLDAGDGRDRNVHEARPVVAALGGEAFVDRRERLLNAEIFVPLKCRYAGPLQSDRKTLREPGQSLRRPDGPADEAAGRQSPYRFRFSTMK